MITRRLCLPLLIACALLGDIVTVADHSWQSFARWLIGFFGSAAVVLLLCWLRPYFLVWHYRRRLRRAWRELSARSLSTLTRRQRDEAAAISAEAAGLSVRLWVEREPGGPTPPDRQD